MMSVPDTNTLFFTIALMFALFAYSCFTQEYKPVNSLNLKNYDGRWYQVYKDLSDMTFQGFGTCAVADYVILSGNNVSVLNSQIDKDGTLDQITGYAFYNDGNSGGELTVDLDGTPGNAPYWVIELGPLINNEYQYSIVSDNLKVSLFILATNVRNIFPVNQHDAICLIVSSCFFLIPGGYAFSVDLPFYGIVSAVTTLVSANYWCDAVEGMRRNADLITAKVSFGIYCVSGFYYMRDWRLFAVGIPGVCGIGFFYYMANKYWDLDSQYWVYFHMLFHLFVALEQALVIYAIVNSSKLKII